jgi:N-acetylmuramoyl-L-alanine amidase
MDKLLLKKAAVQSIALMVAVVTSSFALQQYQAVSISANDEILKTDNTSYELAGLDPLEDISIPVMAEQEQAAQEVFPLATNLTELETQIDKGVREKLSDNFLVIRKPDGDKPTMTLEDLYVNHSIQLDMTGLRENDITSNMILRVRGTEFYAGDPQFKEIVTVETDEDGASKEVVTKDYGTDFCHNIVMTAEQDTDTGFYHVRLLLELDSVYAYLVYEDTNYFYIDLKKPSDVYDKILVIDAGHGGKDAGALSRDKQIYEKNINLGIAMQLKELLDQENIKVYYTRTDDNTVFLRPRATLANSVDSDYFISIHCNTSEVTYPQGTEVLYYDNVFKDVPAKSLAALFSEEIGRSTKLKTRGILLEQMGDIFIMDKAEVPTILIETGYLSNSDDLNYLSNPERQKEIAKGIYNGIMRAYNELPVNK